MKIGSHFENEIYCKHLLLLYGYHGVVNNIPNGTYPNLCAHKIYYLPKGRLNCVYKRTCYVKKMMGYGEDIERRNRKGNFHHTYPQSQFHLSSQKPFQRHINDIPNEPYHHSHAFSIHQLLPLDKRQILNYVFSSYADMRIYNSCLEISF